MIDISKYVQENRKEAYELISKNGGRVEFVEGIIRNDPDDHTRDDWSGSPFQENIPWVVTANDNGLVDTAVLAARCNGDKKEYHVELLCYDSDCEECVGWLSFGDCVGNTDNEVYMFIGGFIKS